MIGGDVTRIDMGSWWNGIRIDMIVIGIVLEEELVELVGRGSWWGEGLRPWLS